jgi:2',3'-cyclic-nucleotide 2'-phosphodiesterase (5'-nucleotidase family)
MLFLFLLLRLCLLCLLCYSVNGAPANQYDDKRLNRRIQPDALDVTPANALEWGQINFLHSTDIHGWFEGHMRERNYRADWGDFISFIQHMRDKADELNVDLLVIDTGTF